MFLMIIVVHNWFEKTKCKWTSDQKILSPKFDKFGQMFDKFGPKNKANLGTDATTSSDKTLNRPLWTVFFFHRQTIRKCQKIDLPVERKSAECEIGH